MQLFARVRNLIRGVLGQWLGRREQRNPEAVYEAAIQERLDQYGKLRQAAAGVLYARTKLSKELQFKSAELSRLGTQLDIAVDHDDDAAALILISRRDVLRDDVERLATELRELTGEAEAAKKNLVAFQQEIARLRDEKVRMAARLANAQARLRLQETLNGLSPEADIRALESVRDHINRLVAEVQLGRETSDTDLERRLGKIREAEATTAARAQLDELKRTRKRTLLPLVMPQQAAAS
ncbi:MAG: PspA/IM30 family protein [Candidatus Binatia bacterium]